MPTSGSDTIRINADLVIPAGEIRLRFVRSSGPGGQHVNKAATQTELSFDVAGSPSLTEAQRRRIVDGLKNLIDRDGVLHLSSQSTRSQLRNRRDVIERFQILVRDALKLRKRRRPTQPTATSKQRRLETKKRRSAIKRVRRESEFGD